MSKFFLRIATPENDFFSGQIEYLSIDTPDGREGFMRGALEKIAVVKSGYLEISDGDERKRFTCGDGLICVEKDGITVLTSQCGVYGEDKDAERADANGAKRDEYAKARLVSTVAKLRRKNSSDE